MPEWMVLVLDVGSVGFVVASASLLVLTLAAGWHRRRRDGRRRDQTYPRS